MSASPRWILDTGFAPVFEAEVPALPYAHVVPEPGGGLLAFGDFTHSDGAAASRIVRLNSAGTRVPGFAAALDEDQSVLSAVPLNGGGVLLLVRRGEWGVISEFEVLRLAPSGTLAAEVGALTIGSLPRLTRMPDGRAILWGVFNSFAGLARNGIVRFSTDGTIDAGWNPAISGSAVSVLAVAGSSGGTVYVSALDAPGAGPQQHHLVRIDTSGAITSRYGGAITQGYTRLAVQSTGALLAANFVSSPLYYVRTDPTTGALLYRLGLVRYLPDGALDTAFGASLPIAQTCDALAVLADDRIVVESVGAEGTNAGHHTILLLSSSGAPLADVRDAIGRERDAQFLGLEASGAVLLRHSLPTGGYSPSLDPPPAFAPSPVMAPLDQRLSRWNPGSLSAPRISLALTRREPGIVRTLQRDATGRILVSGFFDTIDGVSRKGAARFLADGTLDEDFAVTDTSLGYPDVVLTAADGRAIVRTTYLSRGPDGFYSLPYRYVRLRTDGTTDPAFLLPAELLVWQKQLRWHSAAGDGRFLVSYFSPDNNVEENLHLSWLDATGRVDEILPTRFEGVDSYIFTIPGSASPDSGIFGNPLTDAAPLSDGSLLVTGAFRGVNGTPSAGIARLRDDGSIDPDYRPELGHATNVGAKAQSDGSALVTSLDSSSGRERYVHYRLLPDGSRDPAYPVIPDAGHWPPREAGTGLPDSNFPVAFTLPDGRDAALARHIFAGDGSLWGIVRGADFGGVLVRFVPDRVTAITQQPLARSIVAGQDAFLLVNLGTDAAASYQWYQDGEPIDGAQSAFLDLRNASLSRSGLYHVRILVNGVTIESDSVAVHVAANHSRVVNFSARSRVAPGEPQIGGFVVAGASPRPVLLRTTGLALAPYVSVTPLLTDPYLELGFGGQVLEADRGGALAEEVVQFAGELGAFPISLHPIFGVDPNPGSALVRSLDAGVYTASTSSLDGHSGIALFECYTEPRMDAARISNVSVRARTGIEGETLTVGFVVDGNGPQAVLIRASGPALEAFGVPDFAEDPRLVVRSPWVRTHVVAADDWAGDAAIAAAAATVGAFPFDPDSLDAAVLLRLEPGPYTVEVHSERDQPAAQTLVEVYVVESL